MSEYNVETIQKLVERAIESESSNITTAKMKILIEEIVKYSNTHNNYDYLFKLIEELNSRYIRILIECILESNNINAIHRLYVFIRTKSGYRGNNPDMAILNKKVFLLASSQYGHFNLQNKLSEVIHNPDFIDLALFLSFETQEILLDYKNIDFENYPEKNDIIKILLTRTKFMHGHMYFLVTCNTKFFNYISKLLKDNKIILSLYLLNNYAKATDLGDAKLLTDKYVEAFIALKRYDILSKYYKSFESMNLGLNFLQHVTRYFIQEKKITEANLALEKIKALEPTYPYITQAKKELEAITLIKQIMSENIDIENIDKLSGIEFEQLLIQQFQKLGYKTTETPATGDFGADIIVDTENETRFIIQCKRFKSKVNLKAVQEVVGAIAHFNGDLGIVITSSSFLNSAIKLAESNDIELWDKNRLMKFLTGDVSFSEIATS